MLDWPPARRSALQRYAQRYRADYQGMAANVSRSFRFPASTWQKLCHDAETAGQDRTAYLCRLIEEAEPVVLTVRQRAEPGTTSVVHEPGTTHVVHEYLQEVGTP